MLYKKILELHYYIKKHFLHVYFELINVKCGGFKYRRVIWVSDMFGCPSSVSRPLTAIAMKIQLFVWCFYCALVKYSLHTSACEREIATWGLSSLVSVAMSQWLTCRYVNSQLSGFLACRSFNKRTRRTGVKWGLLQSTMGSQVIDDLKSFCAFTFSFMTAW